MSEHNTPSKTEIRRKDRAVSEISEIIEIVRKTKILHLGLYDGEYPYVLPLHYGFEYRQDSDSFLFYLHGAKEGYKHEVIRKFPNACVELETNVKPISGGKIACKYGASYASFIGRGRVTVVEDEKEKLHALKVLMRHQVGRDFEIPSQMLEAVAVLMVEVNQYTAKARRKPSIPIKKILKTMLAKLKR